MNLLQGFIKDRKKEQNDSLTNVDCFLKSCDPLYSLLPEVLGSCHSLKTFENQKLQCGHRIDQMAFWSTFTENISLHIDRMPIDRIFCGQCTFCLWIDQMLLLVIDQKSSQLGSQKCFYQLKSGSKSCISLALQNVF